MSKWYFISEKTPRIGPENMAVDEFLFAKAHSEKFGVLRTYSWIKPTFSIGVSQKIDKVLDLNYINSKELAFVRRITGGKTVMHDDEITYSVISSEEKFFKENDLYRSYELIAEIILNTLHMSKIDAYLSKGSSSILSKSSNPCFSFPTPNEIEVDRLKIVGSAQKRDKFALLQHGSIPFTMNYLMYASGAKFKEALLKKSMTTINSINSISKKEFIENFKISFENFLGFKFKEYKFSKEDLSEIETLKEKYKSNEWNFII